LFFIDRPGDLADDALTGKRCQGTSKHLVVLLLLFPAFVIFSLLYREEEKDSNQALVGLHLFAAFMGCLAYFGARPDHKNRDKHKKDVS